jgi:hypothetical protein
MGRDPLEKWLGDPASKERAEYEHSKRRALERYKIDLTPQLYQELCRDVRRQSWNVTFLGRQTNRLTVWAILHVQQRLLVVYDKQRHRIVTFLPPDVTDAHGVSTVEGAVGVKADPRPRKQRFTDETWPPPGVVPIERA